MTAIVLSSLGTLSQKIYGRGEHEHDRNLERAGVLRSVAMQMTGHKTEAVYRR
jgi:hypothetical protein